MDAQGSYGARIVFGVGLQQVRDGTETATGAISSSATGIRCRDGPRTGPQTLPRHAGTTFAHVAVRGTMSNVQSTSFSASTPTPTTAAEKKAWKASQDFEAIFLRQIFQSMRKATSAISETDEKDESSTQMQDLAWDGMADQAVRGGGFGLAKILYPKMLAGEGSAIPAQFKTQLPTPATAASASGASSASKASSSTRIKNLDQVVSQAATDSGLDPALIHAVIQAESGGNAKAKSAKGALGPMQLMPA